MIALPLEVERRIIELQPENTAPAAAFDIGLIHRRQLDRPERIEARQAMALERWTIGLRNEIVHSRPWK